MSTTAAHLVEHVFPQVPVRQWMVTFPRRLRFLLHRDRLLLGRMRRSGPRTIESGLRRRCPDAPRAARCGAVSFAQRFGSALNGNDLSLDRVVGENSNPYALLLGVAWHF